ncbi:hypothetical protein PENSPDRAFT_656030 [Peniophora sp. CONT]|nr:hypothetical protein PENSPDRAFT_656030 [Peniophora sp. CONT]
MSYADLPETRVFQGLSYVGTTRMPDCALDSVAWAHTCGRERDAGHSLQASDNKLAAKEAGLSAVALPLLNILESRASKCNTSQFTRSPSRVCSSELNCKYSYAALPTSNIRYLLDSVDPHLFRTRQSRTNAPSARMVKSPAILLSSSDAPLQVANSSYTRILMAFQSMLCQSVPKPNV